MIQAKFKALSFISLSYRSFSSLSVITLFILLFIEQHTVSEMITTGLLTFFVLLMISAVQACSPQTKPELTKSVEDSLQRYPDSSELAVYADQCDAYFKIISTDNESLIEISGSFQGSPKYYNSKTNRIQKFCSAASVRRSLKTTAMETRIVNRKSGLSDEQNFQALKTSLVYLVIFAQETIELQCAEHERGYLSEVLVNGTLSELVGSSPWRNTAFDFPFESIEISNSKRHEYVTFNLIADSVLLSSITVTAISTIPDFSRCYINQYRVFIPFRCINKLTQTFRLLCMATLGAVTKTYTLATYQDVYNNVVSGYFSNNGNFLSGYSESELNFQRLRSYYSYDLVIYTPAGTAINPENDVFIPETKFTELERKLVINAPIYDQLSKSHLQDLGFYDANGNKIPVDDLSFDPNEFFTTFWWTRFGVSLFIILMNWCCLASVLAMFGLYPTVLIQAFRRVFGMQI